MVIGIDGDCFRGYLKSGNQTMTLARRSASWGFVCALFTFGGLSFGLLAADKDAAKQTAGILIEKKDNWLLVKADGEDEPVKYLVGGGPDKKLFDALKGIFNASRVQLSYKPVGDLRQVVGIKRQVLKASGTVTGQVVKVYDNFWIEVKPKTGLSDAYAPGAANYNDKTFMEQLRALQPGDSVTIRFSTDFERHRIETLRKNEPSVNREADKKKSQ